LDIGGVNTKAANIKTDKKRVGKPKVASEYFPIWKQGRQNLPVVLRRVADRLHARPNIDAVGVAMTAELSDVYPSKTEGVKHILKCVEQVFPNIQTFVVDVHANLVSIDEAGNLPLNVAGANWAATGWMASQYIKNCIVVDIGSTTTSIIPILDGKLAATGRTDLEKLSSGELVYTGVLRTNVATAVSSIPLRGRIVSISSELFASTADVHLILDNITSKDYTVDTSDGRGKSKLEAMARLARVPCGDIEMLGEPEILDMAEYVARKQVEKISDALNQVCSRLGVNPKSDREMQAVVAGLGEGFIAEQAAKRIGFRKITELSNLVGRDVSRATPAVATALMAAIKLEGGRSKIWLKQFLR